MIILQTVYKRELLGAIKTRFAKHEVVMQQYTAEHQRGSAATKVEELQQSGDLLKQLQQESPSRA